MRKLALLLTLVAVLPCLLLPPLTEAGGRYDQTYTEYVLPVGGDVYVGGYYRKDGTYVSPHYRSRPDGNPYNNYSYPGNVNPYTGQVAPGNPNTYLQDYYSNPQPRNGSGSSVRPLNPW